MVGDLPFGYGCLFSLSRFEVLSSVRRSSLDWTMQCGAMNESLEVKDTWNSNIGIESRKR